MNSARNPNATTTMPRRKSIANKLITSTLQSWRDQAFFSSPRTSGIPRYGDLRGRRTATLTGGFGRLGLCDTALVLRRRGLRLGRRAPCRCARGRGTRSGARHPAWPIQGGEEPQYRGGGVADAAGARRRARAGVWFVAAAACRAHLLSRTAGLPSSGGHNSKPAAAQWRPCCGTTEVSPRHDRDRQPACGKSLRLRRGERSRRRVMQPLITP